MLEITRALLEKEARESRQEFEAKHAALGTRIEELDKELAAERADHAETRRKLGALDRQLNEIGVDYSNEVLAHAETKRKGEEFATKASGDILEAVRQIKDLERRLADATNAAVRECAKAIDDSGGDIDWVLWKLQQMHPDAFAPRISTPESAAPVERKGDDKG
jgi:uncharacterized coiled-coil protein SlyX